MRPELNIGQVNMLFNLTELHLEWFNIYYPDTSPTFSELLRINHRRVLKFLTIDLLGEYTERDIDDKLDRMYNMCQHLFEISAENRRHEVILGHSSLNI